MTKEITYIKGDATNPIGEDNKIIIHICNDIGAWGKGFVLAISKKWKSPEKDFRAWFETKLNFTLGRMTATKVEDNIWVGNMIAQHGIRKPKNGLPPIRYEAVDLCLKEVLDFAQTNKCSVHLPRIGCGLAGGKWEEIEPLLKSNLTDKGIDVTVYDF